MNQILNEKTCPRCGARSLKMWNELSRDEQILAEKLPLSAEFKLDERKRHLFCTRCWYEQTRGAMTNV